MAPDHRARKSPASKPSTPPRQAPRRLAARALPAIALGIAVTLVLGAAFAVDPEPQPAPDAPQLPDAFVLPEPRLGDRATYNVTLDGAWRYDDRAEGVPFTLFTFSWDQGEDILDAAGRPQPTEAVRATGLRYDPGGIAYDDEAEEWVPGPAWPAGNWTAWYRPGTSALVAHGQQQSIDNRQRTSLAPALDDLLGIDQTQSVQYDARMYAQPSYVSDLCLVAWPLQGTPVRPSQPLQVPQCTLSALDHVRHVQELAPAGIEWVRGHAAARYTGEAHDQVVDIWLSPSFPYPLRYQVTDDVELDRNRTEGRGTFNVELVGFEPGAKARGPEAKPGEPMPPFETAPRQPWGMDERGVEHSFPLSQAFALAAEGSPEVAALLEADPDTYVADAALYGWVVGNERDRTWRLTFTNGTSAVDVAVTETARPKGYDDSVWPVGGLWPVWDSLPQLPEQLMDVTYEVGEAWVHEDAGNWYPSPDALPDEWPTVASVEARWHAYAGALFAQEPLTAWGHSLQCMTSECDEVRIWVTGGTSAYDRAPVAADPLAPRPVRAFGYDLRYGHAMFTGDGLAYYTATQLANAGTGPGTGPATLQAPPPGAELPKATDRQLALGVSIPGAAGAGLVGILAGLLYWAWPTIKSGGAAGLFSRLQQDRLVEHPQRARLVAAVAAQPGIHLKELGRATGMPTGALVHHVRQLTRAGHLVRRDEGGYACFFPAGMGSAPEARQAAASKADAAQRLLAELRRSPAASVQELAVRCGLAQSTVSYHLQRMGAAGLVVAERHGRASRLRAA